MPRLIYRDSDGVDKSIDLGADPMLIGRASECQVQTQDALVSRRHARIAWDGGYFIEDLGSSNGVYVGGERVQRAPLRPGDEVRCGSLLLRLVPDVGRSSGRSPVSSPSSLPPPLAMDGAPLASPLSATGAPPPPPVNGRARAEVPSTAASLPPPAAPPGKAAASVAAVNAELVAQLEEERKRRRQAEDAVLTAEQRAATAEGKLGDAQDQVRALTERTEGAERAAREATAHAQSLEEAAREGERWRRKADQLAADIRRARGPGAETDDPTNGDGLPSAALLHDLSTERDRLKQRVADLEAQLASAPRPSAPVAASDEAAMLRRKVEQLAAEVRRLRGVPPGTAATALPVVDEGARIAELESRLAAAEKDRDEARRSLEAGRAAVDAPPGDLDKLRRVIEQLTAENRRLRQGAAGTPTPAAAPGAAAPGAVDDARVADLAARLAQAEKERDAARASAVAAPRAASPAVVDAVAAMDDVLADLRGSVRAAMDEVGVLGVEAPGDSVQVLKEALAAATEQMDGARAKVREVRAALGIPG